VNAHPRTVAREVAQLITTMRKRGCSQQTVMFAVDREYPDLSFKQFLCAVMPHELARDAEQGETVH
jgi:hypothetical protein